VAKCRTTRGIFAKPVKENFRNPLKAVTSEVYWVLKHPLNNMQKLITQNSVSDYTVDHTARSETATFASNFNLHLTEKGRHLQTPEMFPGLHVHQKMRSRPFAHFGCT